MFDKKASGRTLLSYRYDELGRKISQTDITSRQVSYKFDKSNHLVDICNEFDQSIVSFARDADGAIQKITHANGMWQDIAYDADKNITSLMAVTPATAKESRKVSWLHQRQSKTAEKSENIRPNVEALYEKNITKNNSILVIRVMKF